QYNTIQRGREGKIKAETQTLSLSFNASRRVSVFPFRYSRAGAGGGGGNRILISNFTLCTICFPSIPFFDPIGQLSSCHCHIFRSLQSVSCAVWIDRCGRTASPQSRFSEQSYT